MNLYYCSWSIHSFLMRKENHINRNYRDQIWEPRRSWHKERRYPSSSRSTPHHEGLILATATPSRHEPQPRGLAAKELWFQPEEMSPHRDPCLKPDDDLPGILNLAQTNGQTCNSSSEFICYGFRDNQICISWCKCSWKENTHLCLVSLCHAPRESSSHDSPLPVTRRGHHGIQSNTSIWNERRRRSKRVVSWFWLFTQE